jgi:hypothetical protein
MLVDDTLDFPETLMDDQWALLWEFQKAQKLVIQLVVQ